MNPNLVAFERSFGLFSQLPASDCPELVFVGRSNVGKSSMINRMFSRKGLARVSATPGKTATINFFTLPPFRFVDLPGYGYAKVAKGEKRRWQELITGYFSDERRDILLVFSLIDMRHPPSKDDLLMLNYLIDSDLPFVCILTKCDKLSKKERAERMSKLPSELPEGDQLRMIEFSAETGEGVPEIWEILNQLEQEELAEKAENPQRV